jgi:uncharacterized protein YihD (DUF1040 family)
MRDPSRIPEMLAALHNIWKRSPDLRLAQLLVVAANKSGQPVTCPELFHLEDDALLRGLRSYHSLPAVPAREPRPESPNDRFWAGQPIDGVRFHLNQHVKFTGGEFAGQEGFVISLESLAPEPTFRVERMDGFDVTVPQRWLQAVEP